MGRKMQNDLGPDFDSFEIRKIVDAELHLRNWSQDYVAHRLGLKRSTVQRLLDSQQWTIQYVRAFAQLFDWDLDVILGRRPAPKPAAIWDARLKQSKHMDDIYNDHLTPYSTIHYWNIVFPTFTLIPTVRQAMYRSIAHVLGAGPTFEANWDSFGERRTANVMTNGVRAGLTTHMFEESLFDFVNRKYPFDLCDGEEILKNLVLIRRELVEARGYRLLIIKGAKVPTWVRQRLWRLDSLGIVDGTMATRRTHNFVVEHSDDPAKIDDYRMILAELQNPMHTLYAPTTDEISRYLRRHEFTLEKELANKHN